MSEQYTLPEYIHFLGDNHRAVHEYRELIARIAALEEQEKHDDAEILKLMNIIAALEKDKALLIKDLRETWDYEDEHIAEVLKEQGDE